MPLSVSLTHTNPQHSYVQPNSFSSPPFCPSLFHLPLQHKPISNSTHHSSHPVLTQFKDSLFYFVLCLLHRMTHTFCYLYRCEQLYLSTSLSHDPFQYQSSITITLEMSLPTVLQENLILLIQPCSIFFTFIHLPPLYVLCICDIISLSNRLAENAPYNIKSHLFIFWHLTLILHICCEDQDL